VPSLNRIIFWQPVDSPHQDEFLESVAERFPGEVVLGVAGGFPPSLAAQGWRTPEHRLVTVRDVSRPDVHAALTAHSTDDTLHVFSGFFSHPPVWSAFRTLVTSRARFAIYSEAPEQSALTGWLKRCRGRLLATRWAHRFAFVLAIGGVGREFFDAIGFPRDKIVPFGYYLAAAPLPTAAARATGPFRFVSAGQLIRRKGIDLLIDACATLPHGCWCLDLYGDGPERPMLERLVARHRLEPHVSFHGTVPNADLRRALAAADCVVLPSRFDGWGMLVSEALAAGTPVICTDRCGSADLARAVAHGAHDAAAVVASAVHPLAAALARAAAAGPPTGAQRHRCHAVASSAGSPARAAAVFLEAAAGAGFTPRTQPLPSRLIA
jgi:glycosyltransferase involved in cell wall biosynthesis